MIGESLYQLQSFHTMNLKDQNIIRNILTFIVYLYFSISLYLAIWQILVSYTDVNIPQIIQMDIEIDHVFVLNRQWHWMDSTRWKREKSTNHKKSNRKVTYIYTSGELMYVYTYICRRFFSNTDFMRKRLNVRLNCFYIVHKHILILMMTWNFKALRTLRSVYERKQTTISALNVHFLLNNPT